ncbi:MAG: cation:proton antiporter [Candidatus Methanoplasma sp.]|jgi:CPA2 family monovalent cation:H+ antiporter-2|nr:cation:proton antiporter [Candidatus Methanoplasma sp.]
MDEGALLLSMTFLLLVAGICSVMFKKVKMPPIIGYLVAGVILGVIIDIFLKDLPAEAEAIESTVSFLASIGLVLLMFCIGMELNLKKLKKSGTFAVLVSLIQIPLMVAGGYLFGLLCGWDPVQSILFGAIISGSSTAVVTAVLKEQGKLSKDDIETIILITVVEDVAQVILLSMASPLLVGSTMELDSIVWMLLTILIFMAAAVSIGILFVPRALDWIASKMPDEILWITSLGMCFAMALMSVWIGMSMAIGAFLMGVVVSQAKSKSTIEHDITPMKDVFMAMFFISVGLEISPEGLLENIVLAIMIFSVYAILKAASVFIAYFVGNRPMRLGFMSSIGLVAMGEFAFIIAYAGLEAGVLSQEFYTAVISAALISMVALPLLSRNSDKICDYVYNNAPKPVISTVRKAESIRDGHYAKIALSSKSTSSRFKEKAAMAYVDILLVFAIEAVFFLFTPDLTMFLQDNMGSLSITACYTIVLAVNFVAIAIPLYDLIKNLKFVEKVLIDAERKAEARGEGNLQRRSIRFYKVFVRINNWTLVFMISLAILILVPSSIGPVEFLLAMLGGIGIILLIYAFKHRTSTD